MNTKRKKNTRLTDEEKRTIWIKIHKDKKTIRQVRDELGISFGAVHTYSYGAGALEAENLVTEIPIDMTKLQQKVIAKRVELFEKAFDEYLEANPQIAFLPKSEFETVFINFRDEFLKLNSTNTNVEPILNRKQNEPRSKDEVLESEEVEVARAPTSKSRTEIKTTKTFIRRKLRDIQKTRTKKDSGKKSPNKDSKSTNGSSTTLSRQKWQELKRLGREGSP